MRISGRVRKLEGAAPPRPARRLPTSPVAFARGLLAGSFSAADIDRTDPHQLGWAARLNAFLVTLSPGHQAWLRRERERDGLLHPGELLLPVGGEQILAALDAVMRRG